MTSLPFDSYVPPTAAWLLNEQAYFYTNLHKAEITRVPIVQCRCLICSFHGRVTRLHLVVTNRPLLYKQQDRLLWGESLHPLTSSLQLQLDGTEQQANGSD